MKIAFVYSGAENLGVEYLLAVLKKQGYTVDLLFDPAVFGGRLIYENRLLARRLDKSDQIIKKIIEDKYDIAAFSVFSGNYKWAAEIAKKIKERKRSIVTIFGGVHATAVPSKVISQNFIDFVVVGEGEISLLQLIENLQNKISLPYHIQGIYSKLQNTDYQHKGTKAQRHKGTKDNAKSSGQWSVVNSQSYHHSSLITHHSSLSQQSAVGSYQSPNHQITKLPNHHQSSAFSLQPFSPSSIIENLDALPFPDKYSFYSKIPILEEQYMIISGRGCPYSCSFCSNCLYNKIYQPSKFIRKRNVGNVIEELKYAKENARRKIKLNVFRDDIFIFDYNWLKHFADEYSEKINLPYFCYVHPNFVSGEVALLLKQSGCIFVTMGIQSANEEIRYKLLNRNYSNESVISATMILKKAGIKLSVDHIIDLPDETESQLKEAAKFYIKLKPDRILSFWLVYYPGTKILEYAFKEGIVKADEKEKVENGDIAFHHSPGMIRKNRKRKVQFCIFFELIPLLPKWFSEIIERYFLYKFFPPTVWLSNLFILLNSIRIRDKMFWHALKYIFSRKETAV